MVETKKYPKGPQVFITADAFTKLEFYIDAAPDEISGYGTASLTGDNEILIDDMFIFEQESSAHGTDINPPELANGIIELIGNGLDPEKLTVWWHSHVNMPANFSSTDTNTMDNNPNFKDAQFFTSIVGNKKGEFTVRVDQYHPLRLTHGDCDFLIKDMSRFCAATWCKEFAAVGNSYCPSHVALHGAITDEVKAKVHKPVYNYQGKGATGSTKPGAYAGHGYKPPTPGTKPCAEMGCWTRIPMRGTYCSEHYPYKKTQTALEKKGHGKKSVLDLIVEGEVTADDMVKCDLDACSVYVNVAEGLISPGLILCENHSEDYEIMEEVYGKAGDASPSTMLEILEYYIGHRGDKDISKEAEAILDDHDAKAFTGDESAIIAQLLAEE